MFHWEIKENPKWKTCFWEEGEKKSSEFLSSYNEDNLIKIKANLIKNLKVQVFSCIISLKHGWMGLLSLLEVPGWLDRWCHRQRIQMKMLSSISVFWPRVLALLLFLVFLLFCFWENCSFGRQFASFLGVLSGYVVGDKPICLYFMVYIFMVLSLILPFPNWEREHIYRHIPLLYVCLFLPFSFFEKEKKLEISYFLFHLNHSSNIF